MSTENTPPQVTYACPLCISYLLDHPTKKDLKKCPSCGYTIDKKLLHTLPK